MARGKKNLTAIFLVVSTNTKVEFIYPFYPLWPPFLPTIAKSRVQGQKEGVCVIKRDQSSVLNTVQRGPEQIKLTSAQLRLSLAQLSPSLFEHSVDIFCILNSYFIFLAANAALQVTIMSACRSVCPQQVLQKCYDVVIVNL